MVLEVLPDGANRLGSREISDQRNDKILSLQIPYESVILFTRQITSSLPRSVIDLHQIFIRRIVNTGPPASGRIVQIGTGTREDGLDVLDTRKTGKVGGT